MNARERVINRARTYSKRHGVKITVYLVTKGRGKGTYLDELEDEKPVLYKGSVSEVIAVYKNGVRVDPTNLNLGS